MRKALENGNASFCRGGGCSDDSGDSEPVAPDASPQDFVFEKKENKTAALVAYTGRAVSVDIPSKVDDCLVTSIGKTDGSGIPVFKNHTEISELNMPSSIQYIGAEKLADVALNSILSLFGYKSPEEQFREETLKTLREIQDAITKGMSSLSAQIKEISDKITELKDYVEEMEREVFARVDRTEFDTRMTVVRRDIATVDTLYEKYQRAISETNYDVAKEIITQLVSDIEKTDLLTIINYLQSEFAGSAAGSQTPIITQYCTYLKDVYPFMHGVYPKLSNFAKYYQMEMLKAVQLYTEYANYEQTLYSSDSARKTVWEQNSAAALKSFNDALDAIDKLLP